MNYLTAWGVEINAQDNTGSTPLHYATEGCIEIENVHIVMSLLAAGADRSILVNRCHYNFDRISTRRLLNS